MPLSSKIHRDVALEGVSVAYKPDGLIAQELPQYPVARDSDVYYVYSKDTMTIPETLRQKGQANRATWDVSTSSYLLEDHALMDLVYDSDRDNADKALKLDVDSVEFLTQKIALRYEKSAADLLFGDTHWSNNLSLSAAGSFATQTTNVITHMDTGASIIAQQSGMLPNTLVINFGTFLAIKENSSTVDRIKYTSADAVSEGIMAKLFNLDRVLVARAVHNTGEMGLADATTTTQVFLWTNCAWLGYLNPTPGLKKASAMYTFRKNDGSPWKVTRWRDEEEEADAIRVQTKYQHKAVATSCGYLIEDTI
jgi:hypothetical protein